MNRTATLRSAGDVATAPRTTMTCLGPTLSRVPTRAGVAAAPPLRPGSQDTLAPAIVPRSALRASSRESARSGSSRWYGIEPGRARSPTSRLGIPKSPEKSGNRTASGSTRGGPRRTARPRPMARERGERGVFRRSAQEDRGNEVEHRVAPGRCEEETGEQEAHRLRLRGNVGDQDRKEAREGGLRRKDQGRHVVHVKPGRETR